MHSLSVDLFSLIIHLYKLIARAFLFVLILINTLMHPEKVKAVFQMRFSTAYYWNQLHHPVNTQVADTYMHHQTSVT